MEAVISSFLNKQSMHLWRHPNLLGLKCSTVCTLKWGYETTFNLSYINYEAFFAWISSKAISQRVRLFGTGTISRKYLGNFQIYAFISEVSDQSFKLSTFVIYNSGVVHESNVFCTTIFDTHTIKTKSYSWGKVEQVGMLNFCFIFYSMGILKAGICHLLIITQPLYN